MKTLIFNGSPRINGDTVALINELKNNLSGEIKVVSAYHDNINPCMDCRFCWNSKGCCIQDDMQAIYKDLNEVHNLVIASPIYFSQLTGELLSLASRLQTFYCERFFRGEVNTLKYKNGVLMLVGGGDGSPLPAQAMANTIFKQTNTTCIGTVFSLKTNVIPAKKDVEALAKTKEIAKELERIYT